jgi:hypothetical protein
LTQYQPAGNILDRTDERYKKREDNTVSFNRSLLLIASPKFAARTTATNKGDLSCWDRHSNIRLQLLALAALGVSQLSCAARVSATTERNHDIGKLDDDESSMAECACHPPFQSVTIG